LCLIIAMYQSIGFCLNVLEDNAMSLGQVIFCIILGILY